MPKTETNVPCRRRGRPMGKNRTPLSLAERRARNAQYERQRRNETSDAMAQLAEAAGYHISISNGDLLASVVATLQRAAKRNPSDDIRSLRRHNESLMQQITELERRLGWGAVEDNKENRSENFHNTNSKAFRLRNTESNIKGHAELNSRDKVSQRETLGTTFCSSSRASSPS